MKDDETKIFKLLQKKEMSSSAIAEETGFGKNKVINIVKRLVEKFSWKLGSFIPDLFLCQQQSVKCLNYFLLSELKSRSTVDRL